MSEGKNTQIAAVETGFTALANNNILEEALADEYAGLEFSIDRVKLPAGGGTAFEVPAEDGEDTEMVKDIGSWFHRKRRDGSRRPRAAGEVCQHQIRHS